MLKTQITSASCLSSTDSVLKIEMRGPSCLIASERSTPPNLPLAVHDLFSAIVLISMSPSGSLPASVKTCVNASVNSPWFSDVSESS